MIRIDVHSAVHWRDTDMYLPLLMVLLQGQEPFLEQEGGGYMAVKSQIIMGTLYRLIS